MNLISKCNCCVCEPVCKFKEVYQKGVEAILGATITTGERKDGGIAFWQVKNCPHIEVSIKCPHMITKSGLKEVGSCQN